jgi:ABC-2 type transport system ATP-binding protein
MIEARGLTKYYGNFPAIEDVTFSVRKGEVLGFLGPNAAGKTTTMRILTGFMPPTSGTARIAGYDVVEQSLEARRRIGYLPETVPLYTDMTVEGYLGFMGSIRGMPPKRLKRRIDEVIDICRLEDYRKSLIGKLSKGFRQRVGIAQAILHEPEVLVLDEPTIGIDPIQVVETRRLIKSLGGQHTVILSTHILPEVSMVCERVLIIHEGQIVAEDRPEHLAERLQGVERIEVEVNGPAPQVMQALRNIKGVIDVTRSGDNQRSTYSIQVRRGLDLREEIARAIVSSGWGLRRLQLVGMSLEEIFLKLTTREEI